jgi:hypothetical protein
LKTLDDEILELRTDGESTEKKILEAIKAAVTEMKEGIDAERAIR